MAFSHTTPTSKPNEQKNEQNLEKEMKDALGTEDPNTEEDYFVITTESEIQKQRIVTLEKELDDAHEREKYKNAIHDGIKEALESQIETLKNTNASQQAEIVELIQAHNTRAKTFETDKEALEVQKETLKAQMETLQNTNASQQTALTELTQTNSKLRETIESVNEAYTAENNKNAALVTANETLQKEVESQTTQLAQSNESIYNLQQEKTALEITIDQMNQTIKKSTTEIEQLKRQVTLSLSSVGNASQQLSEYKSLTSLLRGEKLNLEQKLNQLETTVTAQKTENLNIQNKLAEQTQLANQLSSETNSLTDQLEVSINSEINLTKTLTKQEAETKLVVSERDTLLRDAAKFSIAQNEAEKLKSALEKEIEVLQKELETEKQKTSHFKHENGQLERLVDVHQGHIDSLLKQRCTLNAEIETLKDKNKEALEEKAKAEKHSADTAIYFAGEAHLLKNKIKELEEENESNQQHQFDAIALSAALTEEKQTTKHFQEKTKSLETELAQEQQVRLQTQAKAEKDKEIQDELLRTTTLELGESRITTNKLRQQMAKEQKEHATVLRKEHDNSDQLNIAAEKLGEDNLRLTAEVTRLQNLVNSLQTELTSSRSLSSQLNTDVAKLLQGDDRAKILERKFEREHSNILPLIKKIPTQDGKPKPKSYSQATVLGVYNAFAEQNRLQALLPAADNQKPSLSHSSTSTPVVRR